MNKYCLKLVLYACLFSACAQNTPIKSHHNDIVDSLPVVRILTTDSPGLLQDAEIFRQSLASFVTPVIEKLVNPSDYSKPFQKVLVNLFLEHVDAQAAIANAKYNWLMVNQEFVDAPDKLAKIDVVLVKTLLAAKLMQSYRDRYHLQFKIFYTKFTSIVSSEDSVKKNYRLALHAAGKSPFKNTWTVLTSWLNAYKNYIGVGEFYPKLVVLCRDYTADSHAGCFSDTAESLMPKIRQDPQINFYSGFVDSSKLKVWQDTAGYYIVPSQVEGYGHYINEGRAKGAVLISTNAAPMNELVINNVSGILASITHSWEINGYTHARAYYVTPVSLSIAMAKALALTDEQKATLGENARQAFLWDTKFFKQRMELLGNNLAASGNLDAILDAAFDFPDKLGKTFDEELLAAGNVR